MTLQDRLNNVEDLLKQATIDEEEYKYMREKNTYKICGLKKDPKQHEIA